MRRPFLGLLSHIYNWGMKVRNYAYDRSLISKVQVKCPVISIGNITVGGTGKTPVTNLILEYLASKNLKVGLISRAYKAEAKEPIRVDIEMPRGAEIFGDEAFMLAQQNPQVQVFVGQSKNEIAQFATQVDQFDILVVDDGFQHRKLHRELDLVLLDVTDSLENYKLVPEGRAREGLESLERADLVILTKTNLIDEEKIADLQKIIPIEKPSCCVSYNLGKITYLFDEAKEFVPPKKEPIFLIAGIAKPDIFLKMVRQKFNENEVHLIPFQDHHNYTLQDIELIKKRTLASPWLLTTQKDLVKLKGLWPQGMGLWVADLAIRIESGKELFYEKIDSCLS